MTFYISNIYDGCFYYRCYLPMLFNGFSGDKESLDGVRDRRRDAFMVTQADTVIFQRPDSEDRLLAGLKLKEAGKKIVFENDDTYKDINAMKLEDVESKVNALDLFIKNADLVTTTTEFLADEYRKLNSNVVVLKNCINPDDFPKPKRNEDGKVRIGIFGSTTMNGDSGVIRELLEELSEREDVQLVMFGLPPKRNIEIVEEYYKEDRDFWKGLKIEWHHAVMMKDYFRTLNDLKLDICLIPRQDNYFNRCKSNLKFLECSMLEIPVIAQGFEDGKSPYQGDEDKQWMFIAQDKEDWKHYTELLIKDKELRKGMGEEAHQYVLDNYDIHNNYKKWAAAYKKI